MARKAIAYLPRILLILLLGVVAIRPTFAEPTIHYVHNDHRGAPIAMTDASQTVVWRAQYLPFGEATVDEDPDGDGVAVTQDARLPGQYYDKESGLHYNYYRDYDPSLGRYVESDPIGIAEDFSDPQLQAAIKHGVPLQVGRGGSGLNHLYGYVDQNPLNFIDPFGLYCYIQKSTGTRVCDTAAEHGYGDGYSGNGDNSAYPDSMNNQCVKDCIGREIQKCVTPPTSPGKSKDVRTAAAQTAVCSTMVVVQCTASAADCDEDDDCEG